jgi:hypothetical protein
MENRRRLRTARGATADRSAPSRVTANGGRVIGVRKADIPGGEALAAILCYPV